MPEPVKSSPIRPAGQPRTPSYWIWAGSPRTAVTRRLSAGMEAVVNGPQARFQDVGVDLRRGQVGVPQHHLDGAQVGAPVEQVGRERMADDVPAERVAYPDRRAVPFQE